MRGVRVTRRFWPPLTRREVTPRFAQGGVSVLPVEDWLAPASRELEARSFGDRAPIAVVKLQLEDHGRSTREELNAAAEWLQAGLPLYARLFCDGDRDFILLAPGVDAQRARTLCQVLLDRIGYRSLWRGGQIYLRCGASASTEGEPFDFEAVSSMADEALAEADSHGGVAIAGGARRGRLRVAGGES